MTNLLVRCCSRTRAAESATAQAQAAQDQTTAVAQDAQANAQAASEQAQAQAQASPAEDGATAQDQTTAVQLDWSFGESTGWNFVNFNTVLFNQKEVVDSKEQAMQMLQDDPVRWESIFAQPNGTYWVIKRGTRFTPEGSGLTFVEAKYGGLGPASYTDVYTDTVLRQYKGQDVTYKRFCRGEGLHDVPGVKLFGDIDPCDAQQRGLADCWLMCSIAAVAEFDGLISKLFEPQEISPEGKYTIRLFDLPSLDWKQYEMDDRVAINDRGALRTRFADMSPDLEVWVPLLEKAFAIHAGGWDKLDYGWEAVGLACLTGCTDIIAIRNDAKTLDPNTCVYSMWGWEMHTFSGNHSKPAGNSRLLDGFDGGQNNVSAEVLFDHFCEWDSKNYIMTASTTGRPGSSGCHDNAKEGLADSHAFTLVGAKKGVCGKFDMLCFRNPWGTGQRGEFSGDWSDDGPKWDEYPSAAEELKHTRDSRNVQTHSIRAC